MSLQNPLLEAFMAICETKTVHGASAKVHITQTGVTQRIRSLESNLGMTLFIRTRKGMNLTDEGEELYRHCLRAKELEAMTMARLRGMTNADKVTVTITGPTSIMRTRIIPVTIDYAKKYSEVLFNFKIQDESGWIQTLKSGKADIAIVPADVVPNEFESKLLSAEKYVLVGPHGWQKKDLKQLLATHPIIDFDETDLMSFNYLKKYHLMSYARKPRHFVNNNESLIAMIEAGLGYGVLTEEFARHFLKNKQITLLNQGKSLEHRSAAVWYRRTESAPFWKDLLNCIV